MTDDPRAAARPGTDATKPTIDLRGPFERMVDSRAAAVEAVERNDPSAVALAIIYLADVKRWK